MGARAEQLARKLDEANNARHAREKAGMPAMTAAQAIDGILINHVHEHLGSIRATTGAK